MSSSTQSSIGIGAALLLGALVAAALSDGSDQAAGVAVPVLAALVAFGINWIAFVPAYLARTERYYDITGTATYLTVVVIVLLASDDLDTRSVVVSVLVAVWALRLGSFLFARIRRSGSDRRFDSIKHDPFRFALTWTLQGLWVLLTLAAVIATISGGAREPFGVVGAIGVGVWLVGFAIEVVADRQKSAFRADPRNEGAFITTGLWAWSRHPNYFGEIVLWAGVAIIAVPVLDGWRWVALISPLFVTVLLTRISGIPMLERRGRKRWGDDPGYQAYLRRTSVLIPRPPAEP